MVKKTERKTLATAQGGGLDALLELAKTAPVCPSPQERLAAARAEREAQITAALKPALPALKALREKGYGWQVLANTASDALGVRVSARHIKDQLGVNQTKPALVRA
jgi:hypothetical protein